LSGCEDHGELPSAVTHDARAGYGSAGSPCEVDVNSVDDQGTTPELDNPLVRVREGSWTHLTMNPPVTAGGHHSKIIAGKDRRSEKR